MNQITYEGAVMFGQHRSPSTFFIFFKEIKELKKEEMKQLGKTLVPKVELIDD